MPLPAPHFTFSRADYHSPIRIRSRRLAIICRRRRLGSVHRPSLGVRCHHELIEHVHLLCTLRVIEAVQRPFFEVALGPAIGWTDEGLDALRHRPIVSLQTVFNLLEQEPGRSFAAEPAVTEGRVGLIARVPHASDVLSGKVTRDTQFEGDDHRAHRKRENLLDLLDKADTLAFLHDPDTGRTIGQAAVAGILAMDGFTTVLPTCVNADEVREYAAASDLPLTADETARVDALWRENFGVTDRYEMPLKSSG